LKWPVNRLTRFEVARLLGARSLQISLGAPVLIKTDQTDPLSIAKEEFKQLVIPITVKRKLPIGVEEVVNIKEGIQLWIKEHKEL